MSSSFDGQRALHGVKRRSWPTPPTIVDDEFLISALQQLFVQVEDARAKGITFTPQGNAFLSELSTTVLQYIEPAHRDLDKRAAIARSEELLVDGANGYFSSAEKTYDIMYPEGGLQAWLVVFGSWCGLLASIGMTNLMGSFQTFIAGQQLREYDLASVGWIFSLYAFLAFFCGVYVGPLFDKYGPRWLILAGSGCVVADMMLLGFCTKYWHFLLVYGGLGGLGTALMYVPCLAVIGHYFKTGRGTALGIAVSSGAFGGIVFPLMLQVLLPSIGFAWSTRILGFIYLFLCIIANLLIKLRLPPDTNTRSTPSFRILQKPIFALTVLGVFTLEWGLFVPLTYICSYAMAQGFSMSEAFNALITLNVGSLLGRILPGILADRIGGYNTNILVTLLAIISTFGVWLPAGQTLPGLTLFALLFGFASGSNISLTPVCLGQTCRVEEYGRYFATCFTVVSIGCLTGVPIAGAIINAAGGSYWGLIVFTGTCYGVGLAAIIAARVLGTGWRVNVRF